MYIALIVVGVLAALVAAFFIAAKLFAARMQHYVFAHQLMPAQMFAEPFAVLAPMVDAKGFSKQGREHLLEFWDAAGAGCSGKHLVPSDAVTYKMAVLGHPNSTAFLVELPPPVKKPEAYYVAMVFDSPGLAANRIRHLRYFTLEYHGIKNGTPKTWVSEWKPEEDGGLEYVDHGEGPAPDKKEFLLRVQKIIKASGSQP